MTNPNDPEIKQFTVKLTSMSLREYYAGLAMQGILSNENYMVQSAKAANGQTEKLTNLVSVMASDYADALIKELNKGRK